MPAVQLTDIETNRLLMKKQFLTLAVVAGIIGSVAAGCSSEKSASSSSDTTKMDSSSMSTPPAATDTMKTDTAKKDTTKTPPKM